MRRVYRSKLYRSSASSSRHKSALAASRRVAFARRSSHKQGNGRLLTAVFILLVLFVAGGLGSYYFMGPDRNLLASRQVSLQSRLSKAAPSAKGAVQAVHSSNNSKSPSKAAPVGTQVAASTETPKVSAIAAKSNQVALAEKALPGRIDPVCVSSHIDRLGASDVDSQTSLMQAAGVNWVRFDVVWAAIEQTKGSYNWSNYDYDVNAVTSKGMKVMAIMTQYGIPSWERIDSSNWLSTPNNMQDFQNFAYAFAQHYKGKISLYEMGNEPNTTQYWPTGVDPGAYTQYLIAGDNGVKAADPASKVISAGLANISAGAFLQGMYAAGAKGHFDYIGFHPYSYPQGPDYTAGATSFSQAATLKQIMSSNGDGSKQIMATEVGWPSSVTSWGGVNESTQATYISRLFQKIEYENYQYIPIACVYDFIDDGTDPTDNQDNFGVIRADYTKKPSFTSLVAARQNYDANFSAINP